MTTTPTNSSAVPSSSMAQAKISSVTATTATSHIRDLLTSNLALAKATPDHRQLRISTIRSTQRAAIISKGSTAIKVATSNTTSSRTNIAPTTSLTPTVSSQPIRSREDSDHPLKISSAKVSKTTKTKDLRLPPL